MRRLTIGVALLALCSACKKTGEGEYQVQTPNVKVGTDTHTVRTPTVEVGRDTHVIERPTLERRGDTLRVVPKRDTVVTPKVRVRTP